MPITPSPNFKAVRALVVQYGSSATCRDCNWNQVESRHTLDNVKFHVSSKGHTVDVTRSEVSTYKGVEKY